MASIKLSEFSKLTEDERRECLTKARSAESIAENMTNFRKKIKDLESKHGMSTAEMRKKLLANEISETYEICGWLILANMLDSIEHAKHIDSATD